MRSTNEIQFDRWKTMRKTNDMLVVDCKEWRRNMNTPLVLPNNMGVFKIEDTHRGFSIHGNINIENISCKIDIKQALINCINSLMDQIDNLPFK